MCELGHLSSSSNVPASSQHPRLCMEEIRAKRVALFDKELKRQQSLISRLEKIQVSYQGLDNDGARLIMNKGLSTPYNCAQRKTLW